MAIGGSAGRPLATARGVTYTTLATLKHRGMSVEDARIVVQGFGNVGGGTVDLMNEQGCTVVGVSDVKGGIYNPEGLNPGALRAHARDSGSVVGYEGGETVTNDQLLTLECDVLIPAALEGVLTAQNAEDVKATVIVEAANGPTLPEADDIFEDRGIPVVPDILANAGGVTVSYFEWVQDLNRDHWSEAVVNEKLRGIMVKAFSETLAIALRESCDMRTAAYLLAVDRVSNAMAMRGLYP